jgi:tetratricopeptide (TPR) repeat protein
MGKNEEAMGYFHRGIDILEKGGYVHPLARAYNNLGVEYFLKHDYENAIFCWEKCYEFAKKTGNKKGMIMSLGNLSDPYSLKGELDKALSCVKKAKELVEDTHDKIALGDIYHFYGKIYSNMKMWKEAFENYKKSIMIYQNASVPYEFANVLLHYGFALYENNNNCEAIDILIKSLALFKECKAERKVKEVEDLLHKVETTQHPG